MCLNVHAIVGPKLFTFQNLPSKPIPDVICCLSWLLDAHIAHSSLKPISNDIHVFFWEKVRRVCLLEISHCGKKWYKQFCCVKGCHQFEYAFDTDLPEEEWCDGGCEPCDTYNEHAEKAGL